MHQFQLLACLSRPSMIRNTQLLELASSRQAGNVGVSRPVERIWHQESRILKKVIRTCSIKCINSICSVKLISVNGLFFQMINYDTNTTYYHLSPISLVNKHPCRKKMGKSTDALTFCLTVEN